MGLLLLNTDLTVSPPALVYDDMTLNEARQAIYQLWLSGWVGPVTTFDNMVGAEPAPDVASVELMVREVGSGQATLGGYGTRRFQRKAVVITTIKVPSDVGTQLADEYAHAVRTLFEGVTLSGGLEIYQVDVGEVGTDGQWYTVVVRSLFNYYETK